MRSKGDKDTSVSSSVASALSAIGDEMAEHAKTMLIDHSSTLADGKQVALMVGLLCGHITEKAERSWDVMLKRCLAQSILEGISESLTVAVLHDNHCVVAWKRWTHESNNSQALALNKENPLWCAQSIDKPHTELSLRKDEGVAS